MEGITKGKFGTATAEDQSWPKKPFSQMAPAKLPLGASSPFQVWQKPYCMALGDAAGNSSSAPNSYLQFARASSSPAQASNENNKTVENPTPVNPAKKNPIPISSAVSGAAITDHTAKTDEVPTEKPNLGRNSDPNMDPKKLKRIMSNRLSAQRSRMRKMQYLADLERQAKAFEAQISALQPQLDSYQNQKQFLILEQKTLDQKVATLEKAKLLRENEIERNKAEVNMLRELQRIQEEQFQAQMYNWDTSMQLMSKDPILNHYTNSDQVAQNGEETSYMKVDMPQKQSQMWIPAVQDEHKMNLTLPNCMGWRRC